MQYLAVSTNFGWVLLSWYSGVGQIFSCSVIQGVSFNYHQRNVRSRVSVSNFQVLVSAFVTKSRCGVRRKFSWGGVHSVAYGGHLWLVCAVCDVTIERNIHVSKPPFWRSSLTQYAYILLHVLFILCVIALNINYQRSKLRCQRKINSTLRHSRSWLQKYQAAC